MNQKTSKIIVKYSFYPGLISHPIAPNQAHPIAALAFGCRPRVHAPEEKENIWKTKENLFFVVTEHSRLSLLIIPSVSHHQAEPLAFSHRRQLLPVIRGRRRASTPRIQLLEFPCVESRLKRRWAALLLVLNVDAAELSDTSVRDLVPLVDLGQRREADSHPVIGAHQIAFCDAAAVLGEDETVQLVDCGVQIMLRECV
jgi:hypothetical protein